MMGGKTVFNTPLGQFGYLLMSFGLTNMALKNHVLSYFLDVFAFIYFDYI